MCQDFQRLNHIFDDPYFQVYCLYKAKVNINDKELAKEKDLDDAIDGISMNHIIQSLAISYRLQLYPKCKTYLQKIEKEPFSFVRWINCDLNLSEQGWINLYKLLVKENKITKEMQNILI